MPNKFSFNFINRSDKNNSKIIINMIVKEKTLSNSTGEEISTDNVKLSNFLYEKIMIQKACHTAFSLLVLAV